MKFMIRGSGDTVDRSAFFFAQSDFQHVQKLGSAEKKEGQKRIPNPRVRRTSQIISDY